MYYKKLLERLLQKTFRTAVTVRKIHKPVFFTSPVYFHEVVKFVWLEGGGGGGVPLCSKGHIGSNMLGAILEFT
jgi:hypothetical protein